MLPWQELLRCAGPGPWQPKMCPCTPHPHWLCTVVSAAASGVASCPGLQPQGDAEVSGPSPALNRSIPLGSKPDHPWGSQAGASLGIRSIPGHPAHPQASSRGGTREVPAPCLCHDGRARPDPAAEFQAVWPRDAALFPPVPPDNLLEEENKWPSNTEESEARDPSPFQSGGTRVGIAVWLPGKGPLEVRIWGKTVERGRGAAWSTNTCFAKQA